MNFTKIIKYLKSNKKVNYNRYLRKRKILDELNIIKYSYDLQTGTYLKFLKKNKKKEQIYTDEIANIINKNFKNLDTFIDCGAGEMNLSYFFINKLLQIKNFFLFDISLNRVVTGKRFLRKI